MKRFALAAIAALIVLPACTTIHPERRTLTDWNWDLVVDHNHSISSPDDEGDLTDTAWPLIDWVVVQPIQVAMLPVSWAGDTFILNPIDAWKSAELANHHDREVRYDVDDTSESSVKNYQYAPAVPPHIVSDVLDLPRFVLRWLWNSTYFNAEPHDQEAWNAYWNAHNEKTAQ